MNKLFFQKKHFATILLFFQFHVKTKLIFSYFVDIIDIIASILLNLYQIYIVNRKSPFFLVSFEKTFVIFNFTYFGMWKIVSFVIFFTTEKAPQLLMWDSFPYILYLFILCFCIMRLYLIYVLCFMLCYFDISQNKLRSSHNSETNLSFCFMPCSFYCYFIWITPVISSNHSFRFTAWDMIVRTLFI